MLACCSDFQRLLASDLQAPGYHVQLIVAEPPHYDPPRYFHLTHQHSVERGTSLQIRFCPFCGYDLNELRSQAAS